MVRNPHKVALLAYSGLCTFEFGIMVELFGLERPELDPWYELQVCGLEKGPLRAAGGIQVQPAYALRGLDRAGTIVIPGWRKPLTEVPPALIRKPQKAHSEGARLLSVCSGAFVLAAAGLLKNQRVATHWKYAQELAEAYPDLEVDSEVLYVDGGSILTSAGSAAGIDLGLHLIRRDFGAKVANQVARRMVVPPHRDGGQQQFIPELMRAMEPGTDGTEHDFASLMTTWRKQLKRTHTVDTMAHQAHMSPRSFARHFKAAVGTTPYRWLIRERVLLAQALLESKSLSVEEVAHRCGFGEAQVLRLHFRRIVGIAPHAYRARFQADQAR